MKAGGAGSCKFSTEEIISAQNFNVSPRFRKTEDFRLQFCIFGRTLEFRAAAIACHDLRPYGDVVMSCVTAELNKRVDCLSSIVEEMVDSSVRAEELDAYVTCAFGQYYLR